MTSLEKYNADPSVIPDTPLERLRYFLSIAFKDDEGLIEHVEIMMKTNKLIADIEDTK